MTEKPLLPILSFAELMAGPPSFEWLIEGIAPEVGIGFIAGKFATGKSWITQDLVLAIATGKKWLGHFTVKQGPVLVIDEENAHALLVSRFNSLLKGRKIKPDGIPIHYAIKTQMNFSPDRNGKPSPIFTELHEWVSTHRPVLIVADSLTRTHRSNEDKAGEMSAMFANVTSLCTEFNCVALFTHHAPHNVKRMRGSVDLYGVADWSLFVDKSGKSPNEKITITHDKARWDKEIDPFKVKFESDEKAETFRVIYDGEEEEALDEDHEKILSILKAKPLTRQDAIRKSGLPKTTFDRKKNELVEKVLIEERKSGNKKVLALAKNATDSPFSSNA